MTMHGVRLIFELTEIHEVLSLDGDNYNGERGASLILEPLGASGTAHGQLQRAGHRIS